MRDGQDGALRNRRQALRILAASTGSVIGSQVLTRHAFADSGSTPCRYAFSASPTVSASVVNRPGNQADTITVTTTNVTGVCPCGGQPPLVEYSYSITVNVGVLSTAGWSTIPTAGATLSLWPNAGGFLVVRAGVRVTCAGRTTGPAVRCRFGTSPSYTVPNALGSQTFSFSLTSNNGNGGSPTGVAACDAGGAAVARSRTGGATQLVPQ